MVTKPKKTSVLQVRIDPETLEQIKEVKDEAESIGRWVRAAIRLRLKAIDGGKKLAREA